jgi:hypothetical protein
VKFPQSPSALKGEVSLAGIIIASGVNLNAQATIGDYKGFCPFHEDDTTPNFNVSGGDDEQRYKCWACQARGDVYDFLQRYEGIDFPTAVQKVRDYRDAGGLPAPSATVKHIANIAELQGILDRADGERQVLPELLVERAIAVPEPFLRSEFDVRADNATVYIPHYNAQHQLTGIKKRWHLDWKPKAIAGSDLTALYGCWRDKGRPDVILCEGESDTWLLSYLYKDEDYDVLGLPHGARYPMPEWLDVLRGRTVTLILDADIAGRDAVRQWAQYSPMPATLRVAILPDGSDANSAGAAMVRQAVTEARSVVDPTSLQLRTDGGVYSTMNAQGNVITVSDFVFDPQRLITMADNFIYEVHVAGKANIQYISGEDMSSTSRMRTWTTRRLLAWKGNDRNLADLIELIKFQSITVPGVQGVDVVGLHDGVFVLPSEVIGASGWGYVPPENDVHWEEKLRIVSKPWDTRMLSQLALLHDKRVITPILGWVAAAPLRSLFSNFPILTVTGGAGWGKTTLIRTVLEAFGFWTASAVTMTGSTPHAIMSYAGSTNAFPVWVDEYRPGARQDTKQTLDQVIRDAWDGASTIKGGMYDSRMKIKSMPSCAPLLVSGEDAFSDTAQIERMVMIDIPKEGRSKDALGAVRKLHTEGFGRVYLTWLVRQIRSGNLPTPPSMLDRPSQCVASIQYGYSLLQDFCIDVCGYQLEPAFDGSECVRLQSDTQGLPAYLEAVQLAVGLKDDQDNYIVAIEADGTGYIKPQSLVKWTERHTDLKLPGSSRAFTRWMEKEFGAVTCDHPVHRRCLKVPNLRERLT